MKHQPLFPYSGAPTLTGFAAIAILAFAAIFTFTFQLFFADQGALRALFFAAVPGLVLAAFFVLAMIYAGATTSLATIAQKRLPIALTIALAITLIRCAHTRTVKAFLISVGLGLLEGAAVIALDRVIESRARLQPIEEELARVAAALQENQALRNDLYRQLNERQECVFDGDLVGQQHAAPLADASYRAGIAFNRGRTLGGPMGPIPPSSPLLSGIAGNSLGGRQ